MRFQLVYPKTSESTQNIKNETCKVRLVSQPVNADRPILPVITDLPYNWRALLQVLLPRAINIFYLSSSSYMVVKSSGLVLDLVSAL